MVIVEVPALAPAVGDRVAGTFVSHCAIAAIPITLVAGKGLVAVSIIEMPPKAAFVVIMLVPALAPAVGYHAVRAGIGPIDAIAGIEIPARAIKLVVTDTVGPR